MLLGDCLSLLKPYNIYVILTVILVFLSLAPPILTLYGFSGISGLLYTGDSTMCHQQVQRSFCIFKSENGTTYFGNCINTGNVSIDGINPYSAGLWPLGIPSQQANMSGIDPNTGRPHSVFTDSTVGYAFGQCARNSSIYLFMLIGALIFPFLNKTDSNKIPSAIWLILALIPIGVDGTTQLIGNIFGWHYYWLSFLGLHESTNLLRVITGGIAGLAVSFYSIPILNNLFSNKKKGSDGRKETVA